MDPIHANQTYYTTRSEGYRLSSDHANPDALARMLRLVDPPPGGWALDIGCGGGHASGALRAAGLAVVALDVTRAMLWEVPRLMDTLGLPNVRLVQGAAGALPLADATFDVVVTRIAAHHFPDLDDAVAEAARVLRPGGRFYGFDLTTPEDGEAQRRVDELERLRDPGHVRSWPPSSWRRALDEAGLEVTHLEEGHSDLDFERWVARADMASRVERELRQLLGEAGDLGGYGLRKDGKLRVLRVECVAERPRS